MRIGVLVVRRAEAAPLASVAASATWVLVILLASVDARGESCTAPSLLIEALEATTQAELTTLVGVLWPAWLSRGFAMTHPPTSRYSLQVAMVVGAAMSLVGIVLLLSLAAERSSISVSGAQRSVSTDQVVAPAPTVDPVSDPVPSRTSNESDTPPTVVATAQAIEPDVDPASSPGSDQFVPRLRFDDDMGTGSAEFSAVTLNEDLGRLLVADDEGRIFEFDLAANGEPVLPARRTIRVAVGAGDIEGLAWMSGTAYVLAHENDGRLTVIDLNDGLTTITDNELQRTIDTQVREENGNGLEGVTYLDPLPNGSEFAVIDERPPTLHFIDQDGQVASTVALGFGLADASDVWAAADGTFWVLSDENRIVVRTRIDDAGNAREVGSFNLTTDNDTFEQPEGLVGSRDGTRIYIVGEAPGPGRFSFGFFEAE